MKKITIVVFVAAVLLYAGSVSALSLQYDFRMNNWAPADGQSTYTVSPITASAFNDLGSALLYQDGNDGLGIYGGEPDEIDHEEWMIIAFDSPQEVWDVFITDLFAPVDGDNNIYGERGFVELFNDTDTLLNAFDFSGLNADQANGEILVSFGQSYEVSYLKFYADVNTSNNNEFSVAGLNSSEVPEPATLILFGTGLAGLAGFARRKKAM